MKKLAVVFGALLVAVASNAAIIGHGNAQNLSFETGDMSSWTAGPFSVNTYVGTGMTPPTANPSTHFVLSDPVAVFDGFGGYGTAHYVSATVDGTLTSPTFTMNPGDYIAGWLAASGTKNFGDSVKIYADYYLGSWQPTEWEFSLTSFNNTWQPWSFAIPTSETSSYTIRLRVVTGGLDASDTAYFDIAQVPEAKGWMMGGALLGVLGIGAWIRRRQQQAKTSANA